MKPLIYIIILNYNSKTNAIDCISSFKVIKHPNYKIVVVDNNSSDGSIEKLAKKFPNVEIIKNKENVGFSEGNNVGIRYALKKKADYIFLLNDDMLFEEDCLSKLTDFAEKNKRIGIIAPTIYKLDKSIGNNKTKANIWYAGGKINWAIGRADNIYSKSCIPKKPIECIAPGTAMLIKKDVFKSVGLFAKEYFFFFEDTDFCIRAQNKNWKVIYYPSAYIWHKKHKEDHLTGVKLYYYNRNRVLFMKKFALPWQLLFFYCYTILKLVRHFINSLFNSDSKIIVLSTVAGLRGETGKTKRVFR